MNSAVILLDDLSKHDPGDPFGFCDQEHCRRRSPTDFSFRRFTLVLAAFGVLPPLLLAAFVILVDPYYLFGSPSLSGINAVRPFYETHVPVVKPYQVRRIKPDAVILGSSRAEVGLDPRHPGWGGQNVFNFGLPSATSYEVMLAFLHAQFVGQPLKRAVVGIDFFGFNIFFPRNRDYQEARFAGNGVRDFADFLAIELANRPRGNSIAARTEVSETESAAPPAPASRDEELWNEALYLALHSDVAAAVARKDFKSGREHYELAGRAERRESGIAPANWKEAQYLRIHPDVAAAVRQGIFLSGYHHYLVAGRAEGREDGTPPRDWNEALYLRLHADVRNAVAQGTFVSGYHHYLAAGRSERREGGFVPDDWNETLYLRIYADVKNEIARGTFVSGYHHYLVAGRSERREGGFVPPEWDETGYLQVNQDVEYYIAQGRFLSGYHHYLAAGRAEKRAGGFLPVGWNDARYVAGNPIARVRLALGEYSNGYAHYAAVGQSQGLRGGFPSANIVEFLRPVWRRLDKAMFQFGELFRLIFSANVVSDALATVRRQSDSSSFNAYGMRVWENQDEVIRQSGGNGRVFRNNVIGWRWYLWLMPPRYMYCFNNTETGMSSFDSFRFMLRRAHQVGTDLRLYMTPLHTSVRQLLLELGLSDRYEFWQKELVRINEEEAARVGRKPFPLWDFSDANTITREAIPEPTDLTPMRWFWEYSHYRRAAGDLILDRVLGHDSSERNVPADFGVLLTGGNIEAHLAQSKAGIENWSNANSELAKRISAATRDPLKQNRQAEAACW